MTRNDVAPTGEFGDQSDDRCRKCGDEIDRDEIGDWVHLVRDGNGAVVGATLEHVRYDHVSDAPSLDAFVAHVEAVVG